MAVALLDLIEYTKRGHQDRRCASGSDAHLFYGCGCRYWATIVLSQMNLVDSGLKSYIQVYIQEQVLHTYSVDTPLGDLGHYKHKTDTNFRVEAYDR